MAFFALLWKARTIEKYRLNYEKEKINSIVLGHTHMEQTLSQRWRHYRLDTKKKISRKFKKWYPEGSGVANCFLYLSTDQTFPNFLLKSVIGFVGGIVLTYLCFMFFVFQLSISLMHATIMSSIIGVLLTLGLAFSYRIRCLVLLLIPQFFSRVGRYTLTCYALVLILTGPATNTLKNSEVLSESMACSQEQIKTNVHQINDMMRKPYNAMKDSIKLMVDQLKSITAKLKEAVIRFERLVLSIVSVIQSSFTWLQSIADICNKRLGTPHERCEEAMQYGISECKKTLGSEASVLCNVAYVACSTVQPFKAFCYANDFMDEAILATVKKKLRNFSEHLQAMFHVEVHIHQSYSFSSNTSHSASQAAAGIVTEIRNRADPLLTWLSWSSCVTSLFLLLIIFRAKYYQHMYETRSRFDNRYVTKELQELDLKRQRQGRETVLPLNRRERAKYITTSSFRLVATEKVYLNRSAVFMAITTFKLLIHMVADYSLYWVLMTIRYNGRYQSDMMPGIPNSGIYVSGTGFVANLFRSIVGILDIPLSFPAPSPIPCLPDPYPPDLRRYTQIGVLIFLLWFFALFEPYGLRLRHLIMGHYRPERAKARAMWLYNHILRTRASFMKFARRRLHREYKYSSEATLTFRQWGTNLIPFQCFRSFLGLGSSEPHCLLCGITGSSCDPDCQLTRCQTPKCPGIYCMSCFADIGELCTICLSPADYGDMSDVSFEKGSDDSDDEGHLGARRSQQESPLPPLPPSLPEISNTPSNRSLHRRWEFFRDASKHRGPVDTLALFRPTKSERKFTSFFREKLQNMKHNMMLRYWDKKYTLDWIPKLNTNRHRAISSEKNNKFDTNSLERFTEFDVFNRTKSIGINTDKNRGVILNMLVNHFARKKVKWSRTQNQKKSKPRVRQYKKLALFEGKMKFQKHRKMKPIEHRIFDRNVVEPRKRPLHITNIIHVHNTTMQQRNLKNIIRSKKNTSKDKMKVLDEFKGIIKAIRFLKNNEITNMANQSNTNAGNKPSNNKNKVTKPSKQSELEGKKSKKKCLKNNKPKKNRKLKDANNKTKTKNSRHRIAGFHAFFSTHWNNFKHSLICTTQIRSDSPVTKEKRNHKRRKKRKDDIELNDTDIEECFTSKDIKHARNVRISAFLAELEWCKRGCKKNAEFERHDESLTFTDGPPPPIITNKIVGMVQLKNLPFQWREAKHDSCHCQHDKKCLCPPNEQTDKYLKIFGTSSKQVHTARRVLERFCKKINAEETPPSSLVEKLLESINATRNTPMSHESSICLSKRTSFYQSFTDELTQNTNALRTDMLFKNERFVDDFLQETSNDIIGTSKFTLSNGLMDNGLIICSSRNRKKPRITRRCKCDVYDDLQRKWTHVKKSLSDKGYKNPLSMMKNFCSSLFGPSCTLDTCPNQRDRNRKENDDRRCPKKPKKCKGKPTQTDKKCCSNTGHQSIQTQAQKDTHTQLSVEDIDKCVDEETERRKVAIQSDLEREMSFDMKEVDKERQRDRILETHDVELGNLERQKELLEIARSKIECFSSRSDPCSVEEEKLRRCLKKQLSQLSVKKSVVSKGVFCEPEMKADGCQAGDCSNWCNRGIQYNKKDSKKKKPPKAKDVHKNKSVGSVKCYCEQSVQSSLPTLCTCATQHVSKPKKSKETCVKDKSPSKEKTTCKCEKPALSHTSCKETSGKDKGPSKEKTTCKCEKPALSHTSCKETSGKDKGPSKEKTTCKCEKPALSHTSCKEDKGPIKDKTTCKCEKPALSHTSCKETSGKDKGPSKEKTTCKCEKPALSHTSCKEDKGPSKEKTTCKCEKPALSHTSCKEDKGPSKDKTTCKCEKPALSHTSCKEDKGPSKDKTTCKCEKPALSHTSCKETSGKDKGPSKEKATCMCKEKPTPSQSSCKGTSVKDKGPSKEKATCMCDETPTPSQNCFKVTTVKDKDPFKEKATGMFQEKPSKAHGDKCCKTGSRLDTATLCETVASKTAYLPAKQQLSTKDNAGVKEDKEAQKRLHKLSLESTLLDHGVQESAECIPDNSDLNKIIQDALNDTMSDTSISSLLSLRSEETRTDTTMCSLATVDFDEMPRRRKFRVKVVTKTNQATITEKARLCDMGTVTNDWWSPIMERKANEAILLEKKKGYNTIEKQKKDLREWKDFREVRKRRRNCGVTTDGRIVTFRSRTQIIPTGLFHGTNDVMSPSRYLLESQRYYNELFSYNFRPPTQMEYSCCTQIPKYPEKEKSRSPLGSRRNHQRKMKRLEECYSPRRQISPRKRQTDSTKTSESPRRKSYIYRHYRHYTRYITPRR